MFMQTITQLRTQCCNCGMEFYIPDSFHELRVKDGRSFYCPAGHSQYFPAHENEVAELKKQKQDLETRLKWSQRSNHKLEADLVGTRRSHAATKGRLAKTRKRIANGVCPCCNRTFANISRHMDSKHPDFKIAVG